METTLAVQACNLCESTNVYYRSELNKFVCNTCGQHMTEQETAVKHLIDNKLLRIAVIAIFLLMCLPGQITTAKAGNEIFTAIDVKKK